MSLFADTFHKVIVQYCTLPLCLSFFLRGELMQLRDVAEVPDRKVVIMGTCNYCVDFSRALRLRAEYYSSTVGHHRIISGNSR